MSDAVQIDEAEQDQMASSMQTVDSAHTSSVGPLAVCDTLLAQSSTLFTAFQRKICSLEFIVPVFLLELQHARPSVFMPSLVLYR